LKRDRFGETDRVTVRKRWTLAPNIRQARMTAQLNTISINTSSSKKLDEDPLARSIWRLTSMEMNMYALCDRNSLSGRIKAKLYQNEC
jgi:hypothetical protein